MLNPSQKLNSALFDLQVKQEAIRDGFGVGLEMAGLINNQVVGLCADLSESTRMNKFAEAFPDRFFQIGVAEQNLVTVASGLASVGKIPFAASYAMFSPGRNWEQIRTTICYNDQPVKIVGAHAGISVGPDGGTHQATEDIALMRVLPRMVVVVPADSEEAKKATLALVENQAPSYLRLARNKSPIITTSESPFELGKGNVLIESDQAEVTIIACGVMVYRALMAAKQLKTEGIMVTVVNIHTIKPLDTELVLKLAKQTKAIVTVEDHQQMGGLGSAVAEFLVATYPVPMELIGLKDVYGQSGEPDELLDYYGLAIDDIIEATKKVITRKS